MKCPAVSGVPAVCAWLSSLIYIFLPLRGLGARVKNLLLDPDPSGLGPQLGTFLAV